MQTADDNDDAVLLFIFPPELPTCLLCVCLSGSVYCEEVSPEMSTVPTLPEETAYLYARFNKITKIRNRDFENSGKFQPTQVLFFSWTSPPTFLSHFFFFFFLSVTLKAIDLTGNLITEIDDGAFSRLTNLEELNLSENRLTRLPALPTKLLSFNANFNKLTTQGVRSTAFKVG